MSVAATHAVIERSEAKGSTQLLMMLMIADLSDEAGVSWAGVKTLAEKCRCDEATARRTLRKLADAGELIITAHLTPTGRQTSNVYTITPGGLCLPALGRQIAGVEGAHIAGDGGRTLAPPTTLNQKKELNPQEDSSSPASPGPTRTFSGPRPKEADLKAPSAQAQRRAARKSGERPKPSSATQAPRYEKPKSQAQKNKEFLDAHL